MKKLTLIVLALVLASCGRVTPPPTESGAQLYLIAPVNTPNPVQPNEVAP